MSQDFAIVHYGVIIHHADGTVELQNFVTTKPALPSEILARCEDLSWLHYYRPGAPDTPRPVGKLQWYDRN